MSLPLRTFKYTLAVMVAIFIAQGLQLQNPMTAGVIALLSLSDTRRTTIQLALERCLSLGLALGLAGLLFAGVGFHLTAFTLFLLLYVPLTYHLKLSSGLVASTVLITQLLGWASLERSYWLNQLALFAVGAGLALLLNLYMPSKWEKIQAHQARIETLLREALMQIYETLRQAQASEVEEAGTVEQLNAELDAALDTVLEERDNHGIRQSQFAIHYVEMRQAQALLLAQMQVHLSACLLDSEESKLLAGFFFLTASQLSQANPGTYLREDIEALRQSYRERPLPQTRLEFENRAELYQLLNDLSRFIQLKVDFYQAYAQDWWGLME